MICAVVEHAKGFAPVVIVLVAVVVYAGRAVAVLVIVTTVHAMVVTESSSMDYGVRFFVYFDTTERMFTA